MTARILIKLVWILGISLPITAVAVPVEGLYRAEVVVTDKGASELKRAKQEGLETVLVKVSGSADAVKHPLIAGELANFESYVSESSYHSKTLKDGPLLQTVAAINYSPSMVDKLLTRAGQPIWPADRPELLVWMVVDQPSKGRSHVTSDIVPDANELLQRYMTLRGQQLVEPLLDLDDQLTLSAQDAWSFRRDSLIAAARRYKVEHWCVLRFWKTGSGQYRGQVQVEAGVHSGLEDITSRTIHGMIQQAVDIAVDRVAAGSSFVRSVRSEEFTLLLESVDDYQDYKAAIKLLEGLEMVRSVRVAAAVENRLDLRLAIDGGTENLLKVLRRNKRLEEVIDLSSSNEGARFSWK